MANFKPIAESNNFIVLDKKNVAKNKVQVISQFEQKGYPFKYKRKDTLD